jgi:dTDP-glucose 4,6-dehydratase
MKAKILIIGSNSFSGSSFAEYLIGKKNKVIGVSRSNEINHIFLKYKSSKFKNNFDFKKIDINKNLNKLISIIKKEKPRIIVNFAAQGMVEESWLNPLDWYTTNFLSMTNLVERIKNFKFIKKFIQFTTPEVYGDKNYLIKENFDLKPSTPYALSRASFDVHLKNLNTIYNFPVIFTRTANVYGPHQQLYRIIPKFIISAKKRENFFLDGMGKTRRSFIHISDVNSALYKIMKSGKIGETYHISTNKYVSLKQLTDEIIVLMKINNKSFLKLSKKDRVGKDKSYLLDSKKIRNKLKWKDQISLKNGLIDTINWINKNFKIVKKLSLKYKHKK